MAAELRKKLAAHARRWWVIAHLRHAEEDDSAGAATRSGRAGLEIDCDKASHQNDRRPSLAGYGGTMRILYRLLFAGLLVVALSGQAAQAKLDGEKIADAFFTSAAIMGGAAIGVTITPEQANFVKGMVGCMIDGRSIGDCGKQAVIKAVLPSLPAEAQQLATCAIGGGNVGNCAVDQVLAKLPEQARPLVGCIVRGGNVGECGARHAAGIVDQQTKKLAQDALDTLRKAETARDELPPALKNVLLAAEGIQEGDFQKIVIGAGKEVAKVVIEIVVVAMVGPAFGPIIGTIVSANVETYGDIINNVMNAVKEGDPIKLAAVLYEAYLTAGINAACELLPDGAFREATCGTIAKVVGAVVGAAADVLSAVVGVLGDIGEGIVKGFVAAVEAVGDGLASIACWIGFDTCEDKKDPEHCGGFDSWAANKFLTCLTTAADDRNVGGPLIDQCTANFKQCYDDALAVQACRAMQDKLGGLVNQLAGKDGALEKAATAYAAHAAPVFAAKTAVANTAAAAAGDLLAACRPPNWDQFVSSCVQDIGKKIPWGDNKCPSEIKSAARPWGGKQAPERACRDALGKLDLRALDEVTQTTPACEQGRRFQEARGQCHATFRTGYTADGKVYSRTGLFAMSNEEAKAEQQCLNEVRRCFKRNPNKQAEQSCVNHAVGCFSSYNDSQSSAAVRLFGASANRLVRENRAQQTQYCLMGPAVTSLIPKGGLPGLLPRPKPIDVPASPVVDLASSVLRCPPREVVAVPLVLAARPFGIVDAGASRLKLPAMRASIMGTRLVSLRPEHCRPARIIDLVKPPSVDKSVPKIISSRGSSGVSLATNPANKGTVRNVATGGAATSSAGSSGSDRAVNCNSAMGRLTGDCMLPAVSSSGGLRLPDGNRPRPPRSGGAGSAPTGSSGVSTVQSSGTHVPRQSQGSSGMSFTPGGGASGQFGPGTNSGPVRLMVPRGADVVRPQDGAAIRSMIPRGGGVDIVKPPPSKLH